MNDQKEIARLEREISELKNRLTFIEELISQHNLTLYGTTIRRGYRADEYRQEQNAIPPQR